MCTYMHLSVHFLQILAHTIIPYLHAINFPARGSAANQTSLQQSVETIFEVKTMYANKTRYGSNLMQFSATDRRARDIREKEYPGKFKKLDAKFVVDMGSGEAGPFSEAQAQFLSGGIIPLFFGAFGDVNDGVEKLVKVLARNAVNADDGISVSPLVNTDRKGGAFAIMLQQFKWALNFSLVRGWRCIS